MSELLAMILISLFILLLPPFYVYTCRIAYRWANNFSPTNQTETYNDDNAERTPAIGRRGNKDGGTGD